MSARHTQGRLTQGRTLMTPLTERWTSEERNRNEAREKCLVFTHFTSMDQGLGRKLVAQCHQGPEDARRLAACWNACEGVPTEFLEEHPAPFSEMRAERDKLLADVMDLERQRDAMLTALNAAKRLFDEALPKFNWGASALDANAIRLLNEVPRVVQEAIAKVEGGAA